MKNLLVIPTVALLAASSPALGQRGRPSAGFEIGQPFPDVELPLLEDGQLTSLRRFRGQKVVLQVFASW